MAGAVPVRDTRYSCSLYLAAYRIVLAMPLFAVAVMVCYISVAFLLSYFLRYFPAAVFFTFLFAAIPAALLAFIGYLFIQCRGVADLTRLNAAARTLSLLDDMQARPHRYVGIVVIRTSDEEWKELLEMAIGRATAVVIDVSEDSGNLTWELQTALRLHRSNRLILAAAGSICSDDCAERFGVASAALAEAHRLSHPVYIAGIGNRGAD